MPDETTPTETDPKTPDPLEAVKAIADQQKAIADSFMKELAAQRAAAAATPHAPAPTSDPAADFAKLQAECDQLLADGHGTEAMAKFAAHFEKQRMGGQVDPTTLPAYKHMVESTRREVRADNKDVFDKWGGEIKSLIDALPPEKRLLHDEWEDAVARVRGKHLPEILAEQEQATRTKIEEEYKSRLAPLAGGSRGGRAGDSGDNEDAAIAAVLGVTPEAYTASKKAVEEYHSNFGPAGYALLDERLPKSTNRGAHVIKKGAF